MSKKAEKAARGRGTEAKAAVVRDTGGREYI